MPTKAELEAENARLREQLAEAQGWHDKLGRQIEAMQSELAAAAFQRHRGRLLWQFQAAGKQARFFTLYEQALSSNGGMKAQARRTARAQMDEEYGDGDGYSDSHMRLLLRNRGKRSG